MPAYPPCLRLLPVCSMLLLATVPTAGRAQQEGYAYNWSICADDGFPEPFPELKLPEGQAREEVPVAIDAESAVSDASRIRLEGNAVLQRADQRLAAPSIDVDRARNTVTAEEGLRFDQGPVTIFAERGRLEVEADRTEFGNAEFFLRDAHLRGTAGEFVATGDGEAQLAGASFTTCPVGSRLWAIHAREVELHRTTGRGEAWHATFRLGGVPVLYTPYFNFPIDDRRYSGLLFPQFGYSDRHGFDLTVPYYWNIAPERDFTFLPRHMSERGLMLGGQYRYLGRRYQGEIAGTYLREDREFGDDRSSLYVRHRWQPSLRSNFSVNYNEVSDREYLEDFGGSLSANSASFLPQTVAYSYSAGPWQSRIRAQRFQPVDEAISEAQEPYSVYPEAELRGSWPQSAGPLTFNFLGAVSNFQHDTRVDGVRVNTLPSFSLPLLRPWGFLSPKLSLSYTSYSLNDNRRGGNHIRRAAPIFSVDSGLIFERPMALGDRPGQLTLEPRLFYLYVPFRDQSEIPNFDSPLYSEDFYSLFRENRFTGPDRLGDANQITTALTSRWLVEGNELARLSVGQIQYFQDREVTPSGVPETRSSSDIIGDFWLQPGAGVSVGAGINWNPEERRTTRSRFDLRYNPEPGKVLNLAYRVARDDLEQADLAALWPLGPRWKLFGRWFYDLDFDRTIEAIAGLQYEDCCWAVRFAARHYRDEPEAVEADNGFYVEFILKGLGGVGTAFRSLLSDAMPGFQDDLYR